MATYSELVSQIEDLKKQAERQRKDEYSTVLKHIKRQIADYGISAEDLGFGSKSANKKVTTKKRSQNRKTPRTGAKVPPKYRDQSGNTWTGRGKTPKWVTAAIESGMSLESLRI